MTEQTTSPSSVGVRYGLITGFISVIFSLVLYVTEMHQNKWMSVLSILILVAGIVMAHSYFKKENMGFMSYGQGLGIGVILSAVAGVLGSIFTFVYVKFIDTGFLEKARNAQIEEMEKNGMSDDQIEQAMNMAEKFSGPGMMLVMGIVGSVVIGLIISLIVAAIMKKSRPEFE
ncbi:MULTISPECIES: DUF4199 domain-containing protein [Rufibacter]|uniref:FtsH-binding integral membrane protein n=1 Tax=Rufibacter quisquiliarum TaxID=1549639 RepID=A0A839GI54_9BACT|nr:MULTISPECIES: DUF4199 domain-containing protein [Rufibacter]MBA9079324.1 FtsH-binding integral membrane protein [Rufibacter quisquiliarum]